VWLGPSLGDDAEVRFQCLDSRRPTSARPPAKDWPGGLPGRDAKKRPVAYQCTTVT
jgi:hypothetical protein